MPINLEAIIPITDLLNSKYCLLLGKNPHIALLNSNTGSLSATPLGMGMGTYQFWPNYTTIGIKLQLCSLTLMRRDLMIVLLLNALECDNMITVRTETPAESEDKPFQCGVKTYQNL